MDWVTNYELYRVVLCNKINNVFNKLGNIKMSKQEIIEQLKNI